MCRKNSYKQVELHLWQGTYKIYCSTQNNFPYSRFLNIHTVFTLFSTSMLFVSLFVVFAINIFQKAFIMMSCLMLIECFSFIDIHLTKLQRYITMGASNSHEALPQDSPPNPQAKGRVLAFDPRSPSTDITRTPIVVDKTPEVFLQDAFDPRSPTVGIDRTPLTIHPEVSKIGTYYLYITHCINTSCMLLYM